MADETTTRRCIGSKRFGIEPHDAPVDEFPKQKSQKDGLGRMCTANWNAYTAGLARDAKARHAAAGGEGTAPVETDPPVEPDSAPKRRRQRDQAVPTAGLPSPTAPMRAAEVAPATNGASGE